MAEEIPTEQAGSSLACRSRGRYSVSSPECRDDRVKPFILIYCQIRGVDQLGETNSGGVPTPLRDITADLSRLICLLEWALLRAFISMRNDHASVH